MLFIVVSLGIIVLSTPIDRETPQLAVSTPKTTPQPSPRFSLLTPQTEKILANDYHVFQTFNNCGPAALSMALSYYNIERSQVQLGQELRPWQNPQGDNDDKSVTLEELANKSKEYGLIPYHRPNGSTELIKLFISYDIPVITRTWLKPNEDIGHYRIIKGYTKTAFVQDDSLQGKNLSYSYAEFNDLWQKFNYEYLVLIPPNKQEIAKTILKDDVDPKVAWQKSVALSKKQLEANPGDIYARFNLSVALHNIGDYQQATLEFEKVEDRLPMRTLWYQIEPIGSYYELGNYARVFSLTDKILNNHNRAYSEAYIIRGKIFEKQGNTAAAQAEFDKARLYNKNIIF
jgi:tetratricopeptide (TPR) repeat protein